MLLVVVFSLDRQLSGHIDLVRVFRPVGKHIFGIDNQGRMAKDKIIVIGVMIGGNQDAITLVQVLLGDRCTAEAEIILSSGPQNWYMRVVVANLGATLGQ